MEKQFWICGQMFGFGIVLDRNVDDSWGTRVDFWRILECSRSFLVQFWRLSGRSLGDCRQIVLDSFSKLCCSKICVFYTLL